ncbi:MAG: protein kinase [Blastocatellia bacterium]
MKESTPANKTISHYRILQKLGAGGMGEVYLAEDTQLDRKVAIKFLPPGTVVDDQARRRLVREAKAAAKLDHPNICAIHEVGEADGQSFIVMQYVEGETLASRLRRKPFGLPEAMDIATQTADALAEAHSRGIIHRDIKPQNIMITARNQVKVMDFGLARVVKQQEAFESEAETESVLTDPGVIVGTVPYMSPEQVKGESLDLRSDIFSFGAVLYEMVSGRQPFASDSAAEIISAILTREPPPLVRYSSEVPNELQRIITKAMTKDRERRCQSMRDLALDLDNCRREYEAGRATASHDERMTKDGAVTTTAFDVKQRRFLPSHPLLTAVALLVIIAALALAYVLVFRGSTAARPPEIRSLAVLPLENLSGDPSQEYFADGMTEAIIGNLAQIRALRVVSRTSVMRFKGSRKPLPEIAQELNVDAVIAGSVQRASGRVKITAQLIHAATDAHLWARDYERDLADVLKLQSEVARAVADEIRIQVTAEERARLASARSVNPQAQEAYLLGRFHLRNHNEEDLKKAIEHFERAIHLAPDYAAAYAGLAAAWLERGVWGAKEFKEVEAPARNAALKAIELDADNAEAHAAVAQVKFVYDWDWAGAEEEFKRALGFDPGSLYAHFYYATMLMALGRHDEAIREMQSAEQMDPLSSMVRSTFGRVLYRARKYEEAALHLKRAIELDSRNYSAYVRLGDVYAQLGSYDEALAAFEKAGELRSDGFHAARIARIYALMGRLREARQMLSGVKAGAFDLAAVYVAVADKDEAFRILEKAIEERDSLLVFFKEDPNFDDLHSDPRWKALLRRMNFPPE